MTATQRQKMPMSFDDLNKNNDVELLVSFLGRSRDAARSRDSLCYLMQRSDRAVRKIIEEARNRGYVILNDQSGRGYWLSEDPKEIEAWYRQVRSRAISVFRSGSFCYHYLRSLGILRKESEEINGQIQILLRDESERPSEI